MPFFQKGARKIDIADIFSRCLRQLGICIGYIMPPTIHAFRAKGLYLIGKLLIGVDLLLIITPV
jgi:hypothetical protein